jgi:hypothetical protein
MTAEDLRDRVCNIGLRIDAAEFTGFNKRSDEGPVFAAAI